MERTSSGSGADRSLANRVKNAAITGLALIIPLVVTLLVLLFVWGFIASLLSPISEAISNVLGLDSEVERYILLATTTVGVAVLIVVIGLLANVTSRTGIEETFDDAIAAIPGVGGIYSTFNDMSELLLDSDSQSFQEVVLVEYPNEDTYCVAFLTTDTPEFVREAVGEDEMITVFMPMGPNPFMGGFVLHVSGERVHDVDMTVEEGIQSIVTSGAAMGMDEEAGDAAAVDAVAAESTAAESTAVEHGAPATTDSAEGFATIEDEATTAEPTDGEEGA